MKACTARVPRVLCERGKPEGSALTAVPGGCEGVVRVLAPVRVHGRGGRDRRCGTVLSRRVNKEDQAAQGKSRGFWLYTEEGWVACVHGKDVVTAACPRVRRWCALMCKSS